MSSIKAKPGCRPGIQHCLSKSRQGAAGLHFKVETKGLRKKREVKPKAYPEDQRRGSPGQPQTKGFPGRNPFHKQSSDLGLPRWQEAVVDLLHSTHVLKEGPGPLDYMLRAASSQLSFPGCLQHAGWGGKEGRMKFCGKCGGNCGSRRCNRQLIVLHGGGDARPQDPDLQPSFRPDVTLNVFRCH